MKIILLRHGETEEEKNGIVLGHLPGTLSQEGKMRAEKNADIIEKMSLRPEIIITSDLARAADYAAIIGKKLNIETEQEPLVRERGAGVAEGKHEEEIDWEEYEKNPAALRKHRDGESFEDVRARVKKFLDKMRFASFQVVILVSHEVFLGMLMMDLYGWPLDRALRQNFRDPLVIDMPC